MDVRPAEPVGLRQLQIMRSNSADGFFGNEMLDDGAGSDPPFRCVRALQHIIEQIKKDTRFFARLSRGINDSLQPN